MRPLLHGGRDHGAEAVSDGGDVGEDRALAAGDEVWSERREAVAGQSRGPGRHLVGAAHRGSLG
jgi:hypothetical protein